MPYFFLLLSLSLSSSLFSFFEQTLQRNLQQQSKSVGTLTEMKLAAEKNLQRLEAFFLQIFGHNEAAINNLCVGVVFLRSMIQEAREAQTYEKYTTTINILQLKTDELMQLKSQLSSAQQQVKQYLQQQFTLKSTVQSHTTQLVAMQHREKQLAELKQNAVQVKDFKEAARVQSELKSIKEQHQQFSEVRCLVSIILALLFFLLLLLSSSFLP
jgi:ABC-type Na+ efflux pump permease subunit